MYPKWRRTMYHVPACTAQNSVLWPSISMPLGRILYMLRCSIHTWRLSTHTKIDSGAELSHVHPLSKDCPSGGCHKSALLTWLWPLPFNEDQSFPITIHQLLSFQRDEGKHICFLMAFHAFHQKLSKARRFQVTHGSCLPQAEMQHFGITTHCASFHHTCDVQPGCILNTLVN